MAATSEADRPVYRSRSGSYAQLVLAGKVVRSAPIGPSPEGVAPAAIPPGLPGSAGGPPGGSITYTAPAPHGEHGDYRIRATAVTGGGTLIVAIPLTEVHATLRRLLGLETLIGIAVLIAVALLAGWLVRVGLRPLTGIGDTAGAIAAGDLTRRVEPADERTEVGRLGIALNTMLAHIEAAFEQRRRSEERLRRFVADASHELRTPLTSIRGYAELFRRGAESRPEDLAKSMSNIESEASRMGVLVDDLLLLARLDQGRPLDREPLDLVAVASEAVESARAIDPDRTIELVADDPVRIVGDASRLRQVIDNLLDNTRVHAPGSPVRDRGLAPGRRGAAADRRPGAGPRPRGGRADLRAVHARRPVALARNRGRGARSVDRSGDRGGTWRRGDGVRRCGRRYGLRRSPSGRRSSRRPGPPRRIPA